MSDLSVFDGLFEMLPETRALHGNSTHFYQYFKKCCDEAVHASPLRLSEPTPVPFGAFGSLTLPYHAMGAIDSLDLFGMDELLIFAFYWANRNGYRRTVDIGANLGLHSILMDRCGFEVTSFEPDPVHLAILKENLARNNARNVTTVQAAVSDRDGEMEFLRLKGNTTGSHLAGSKSNPYGEIDRFAVAVNKFETVVQNADFAKIDAEGHEVVILGSLPVARWTTLDAMVEISSPENASAVFECFSATPVNIFAQKGGWSKVVQVSDMPVSHRDGSIFVTTKPAMPWG